MAPDAKILAIEPDDRSVAQLKQNVLNARISQRTHVLKAAVGENAGDGVVVRSQVSSTVSYVEMIQGSNIEMGETKMNELEMIPVLTLSTLLDISGPIDIMKIDCEGSEFPFFESADSSALSKVKNIIGEYHIAQGSFDRLRRPLVRSGFEVRSLIENDVVGLFVATRSSST